MHASHGHHFYDFMSCMEEWVVVYFPIALSFLSLKMKIMNHHRHSHEKCLNGTNCAWVLNFVTSISLFLIQFTYMYMCTYLSYHVVNWDTIFSPVCIIKLCNFSKELYYFNVSCKGRNQSLLNIVWSDGNTGIYKEDHVYVFE